MTKSCPHFFILKRDLIKCYNLIECVSKWLIRKVIKVNKERKNIGLAILLIFSSLLVCLDRIFWQSSPDILINDKVNIQQSLMQIYHASTLIGIDIFAIGLGFLLQSSEDKSWSSAIKYWIYILFLSVH